MGISNYENVKWRYITLVKKQLNCKVCIYNVTEIIFLKWDCHLGQEKKKKKSTGQGQGCASFSM